MKFNILRKKIKKKERKEEDSLLTRNMEVLGIQLIYYVVKSC
jgi:uncharacterized protein (UPF0335 family)